MMSSFNISDVKIRLMKKEDLDTIVEIDKAILGGEGRREYYQRKIDLALNPEHHLVNSLVAEYKGKVIGFIIGDLYIGEYGIPETVATLDTIGVHPDYQDKGVGKLLIDEFITTLRGAKVNKIYTMVDWEDLELIKFFKNMGFVPSRKINLEMDIKEYPTP